MENTKVVAGIEVPNDLDKNGFQSGKHYESNEGFRTDVINMARVEIARSLVKSKSINSAFGSYGLKHTIQKAINTHISNGELIVAMIGEGYTFQRDTINCFFNLSTSSVKHLHKLLTQVS